MNSCIALRRNFFSTRDHHGQRTRRQVAGLFVPMDLWAATCILLLVVLLLCSNSPVASAWTSTRTTAKRRQRQQHQQHNMIAPQQLGSFEALDDDLLAVRAHAGDEQRRVRMLNWVRSSTNVDDDEATTAKRCVDFHDAWDVQKELLQSHLDRLQLEQQQHTSSSSSSAFLPTSSSNDKDDCDALAVVGKDTVIFLEHAPVYTLGTGSDERFVKQQQSPTSSNDSKNNNKDIPVIRMDRGGEVTYHGPGQLTVYPVLDLRHYKQDIHWYVRALEEVVILALQECGIDNAAREPGVTGVWVGDCKVAAVGVKCKRWITQHGVAINVTPESLPNFGGIVPCGLEGRRVGCVQQFLDADCGDEESVTVQQMATYVRSALEDVFRIQLVQEK